MKSPYIATRPGMLSVASLRLHEFERGIASNQNASFDSHRMPHVMVE